MDLFNYRGGANYSINCKTSINNVFRSMTKERPILFSTEMVKAILDGHKTQTRRVVKPQPPAECSDEDPCIEFDYSFKGTRENPAWYASWEMPLDPPNASESHNVYCPYGKPGDVLWVRETWQPSANDIFVYFKADYVHDTGKGWKPSIHMPKSVARIWLEITNIRVERLQDISEDDAKAEGIDIFYKKNISGYEIQESNSIRSWSKFPYHGFKSLWISINGHVSWELNPWVWVIEFKII